MLRAVLFDCDGVLLDSESIYLSCVSQYLKTLGREAGIDELAYLVGADIRRITEQLQRDYDLGDYEPQTLIDGQRALFHREFYGRTLEPMDGLVPFLQKLRAAGLKTAVASSSDQNYVEYVLDQLGIRDDFDVFIGREAAGRSKPFPDLYEEAMRRLGVRPEESVVLEDSSNGIRAGLDAGCYVLAYKGAKVKQDTAGAHRTVYHYGEIDLKELEREVEQRGR